MSELASRQVRKFASVLDIPTELMFQVWLRLDANWLKIIFSWGWLDQAEIRVTQPQLR